MDEGLAVVTAGPGERLRLAELPAAVDEAGFLLGWMSATARGRVLGEAPGGGRWFETPGGNRFLLRPGPGPGGPAAYARLVGGQTARVEGILRLGGGNVPLLLVEKAVAAGRTRPSARAK